MMRVCIVGDSHIGALQLGWRALRDEFPGIEVTMFGAPRDLFAELAVSGGRLVPSGDQLREYFVRTSGGKTEIADDYDHYLVCGLNWAVRLLLPSIGKYRCEDQVVDRRIPMSNDSYGRLVRDLLRDFIATEILVKLRQITDRPIDMIPAPMPSEAIPAQIFARVRESGDAGRIAAHFLSAASSVAKDAGAGFLEQPAETLSNPIQTLLGYSRGSIRTFKGNLDIAHGNADYQHMNAAYGALVLRAAFMRCHARIEGGVVGIGVQQGIL
jgi:hypothetical protein